jgi:hypothetical protein
MPAKTIIKKGDKFNRLTFIEEIERHPKFGRMARFQCECNNFINRLITAVVTNNTKSCGCLNAEKQKSFWTCNVKHKESLSKKRTVEYITWCSMRQRCLNINATGYENYGGRGIKICDRWMQKKGIGFSNFLEDMGRKPGPKYSIDRINVDGNYEPDNCRWVTIDIQNKNKRKSIINEL